MLLNHLDGPAAEKIVGLENNYERAMVALNWHYNNSTKIIATCIKKIKALPEIMHGEYEALVSYKSCLVNNHARLSAVGLEHEVSGMYVL